MTYRTHASISLGATSLILPIEKLNNTTYVKDYYLDLQNFFITNTGIESMFIINSIVVIFILVFLLIGSLFPDIDHGESYLQKRTKRILINKFTIPFYMMGIAFIFMTLARDTLSSQMTEIYMYIDLYLKNILIWMGSILISTYALLFISAKSFKHRGPTHSAIYLSLFFGLIYGLLYSYDQSILFKTIALLLFIGSITHLIADMFTKSGVKILAPITNKAFRLLPKKLCIVTCSKPEFLIFYPAGFIIFIISVSFYFFS